MKVFVPQNWEELKEDVEAEGKTIVVEQGEVRGGEGEGEEVTFNDGKVSVVAPTDIYNLLEFLAGCGYDFVAVKNKETGFPQVSTLEEVMELPNFESLQSLIAKVKTTSGSQRCGAIGVFIGFVRELSDGKQVTGMEFEENEDTFYAKLAEIEDKLKNHEGVVDVRIHHRTGTLLPGEDIIYVVIMGEHRKDVWTPLEKSMDIIKKELPIWKKEVYVDGEMWVHDTHNN